MELSIKRQKAMVKRRRRSHPLKWRALAFVLAVVLSLLPAMGLRTAQARSVDSVSASVSSSAISIQEQPFYPSLEEISSSWTDIVLGQVVGESPKVTLLNFYAVMAKVGHRADS